MQTSPYPNNLPTGTPPKPTVKERVKRHAPLATKALAVVGLVVVLVLLIGLAGFTAKYAGVALRSSYSAAVSLSSKLFSNSSTTTPSSTYKSNSVGVVESGKSFTLSWEHLKKTTAGSYALSYPCVEGLSMKAVTPENGTETVPCNKAFDFINHNNEIGLKVTSDKFHSVDLPISILFTKNGEKNASVSGVITITVENSAIATSTDTANTATKEEIVGAISTSTTKKPTGTGTPTTVKTGEQAGNTTSNTYQGGVVTSTGTGVNNPNGKPDLRPAIIETGYLDNNNNFIKSDNPSRANRIAVRFSIENIGDKVSPTFRFNAFLPTYPGQTFNSDIQPPVYPGDHVEYTLGFDRALSGLQNVHIQVDGGNEVTESNESNNDAYVNININ
jgi:hypothetical protein